MQSCRGIDETLTCSDGRADGDAAGRGRKITVSVCSYRSQRDAVGFENSRLFRTPTSFAHIHPGLRDHPGAICLVHRRRGVRVSRVSIHPVREKRRSVFLRAGLNLIIGKQARFSNPASSLSASTFASTFACTLRRPESAPASRFSLPSPPRTDVRSHSATSRLNLGRGGSTPPPGLELDITRKYPDAREAINKCAA